MNISNDVLIHVTIYCYIYHVGLLFFLFPTSQLWKLRLSNKVLQKNVWPLQASQMSLFVALKQFIEQKLVWIHLHYVVLQDPCATTSFFGCCWVLCYHRTFIKREHQCRKNSSCSIFFLQCSTQQCTSSVVAKVCWVAIKNESTQAFYQIFIWHTIWTEMLTSTIEFLRDDSLCYLA